MFLRTDGAAISERIENIEIQKTKLETIVFELTSQVDYEVQDSPEMSRLKGRLTQLKHEKQLLENKRQRMFMRWRISQAGVNITSPSFNNPQDSESRKPAQSPSEASHLFSREELEFVQNSVHEIYRQEQKILIQVLGTEMKESQMARFAMIYRFFERAGVPKEKLVFVVRCYSSYIATGTDYYLDKEKVRNVHSVSRLKPSSEQLQSFQFDMEKELHRWKQHYLQRFGIETERYSRLRLQKMHAIMTKKGLSNQQIQTIILTFERFIKDGTVPTKQNTLKPKSKGPNETLS